MRCDSSGGLDWRNHRIENCELDRMHKPCVAQMHWPRIVLEFKNFGAGRHERSFRRIKTHTDKQQENWLSSKACWWWRWLQDKVAQLPLRWSGLVIQVPS